MEQKVRQEDALEGEERAHNRELRAAAPEGDTSGLHGNGLKTHSWGRFSPKLFLWSRLLPVMRESSSGVSVSYCTCVTDRHLYRLI